MKKRNKLFLIIVFLVNITACSDSPSAKEIIAGNTYKLWVKRDAEETARKITTYYYFDAGGKFQVYKKYKNSKVLEKLDMGDVVLIEEWKILSKNFIYIAGNTYKILKLNRFNIDLKDKNKMREIHLSYEGDKLP